MSEPARRRATIRPAGYAALLERYGLAAIPNWHRSQVAARGVRRIESDGFGSLETYPSPYWPGDTPGDQLEFALKYDGINLGLLATILPAIGADEVARYVASKPTGKRARRIWYFYEMLTGSRLPLADLSRGNYVDLFEEKEYFTLARGTGQRVRRQRVNDNALGDARFCPAVRRTRALERFIDKDLSARSKAILSAYSPELLRRALGYLYKKETKSSFEIEDVTPSVSRTERFVSLLRLASRDDLCGKARLIELQSQVVDPRFREGDYRSSQNYIGQTVAWQDERIHYACPKPEHVHGLMAGLIGVHHRMEQGSVHPAVQAAVVAYGFVFIHPFEDGNGRIHRLLIHNILARRSFVPEGVIFPVSAVMLRQPAEYDASLEAFSRPLMELVEYTLDDEGRMTVTNDVSASYAYPDMTPQVEALAGFIEQTVEVELAKELDFLERYDKTKAAMQETVDMPDRELDLFIRFCLQNNGRLSDRKRESHFARLTEDEARQLEQVVAREYQGSAGSVD